MNLGKYFALVGRLVPPQVPADSPVFVIGSGRCGSSLFADILRTHSSLAVYPNEANDLWHPGAFPIKVVGPETLFMGKDAVLFTERSRERWTDRHRERIRRAFRGFAFFRARHSRIVVVKSAMVSLMVPDLHALFPRAKYIHLYRYGAAVVESLVDKEWARFQTAVPDRATFRGYCAAYWNSCILAIEDSVAALDLKTNGQFLEFSYEKLCSDPRTVLEDVAEFLGIAQDGYAFDVSQIRNQNLKSTRVPEGPGWNDHLMTMDEGLRLKGY